MLVIQFKAVGIAADTVYEHWLARSKVLQGVRQASLAAQNCVTTPHSRQPARGKTDEALAGDLQPLVVTTSEIFTGWNPRNSGHQQRGLLSILQGLPCGIQQAREQSSQADHSSKYGVRPG